MTRSLEETAITDDELVLATLDGDVSAFGVLVERHWSTVVALAISRIGDAADADDIAQDSLLKAYAQLPRLRHPERFAGWLSKITLQECTNTIRRSIRHRTALRHEAARPQDYETAAAYSANPGLSASQIHSIRETVSALPHKSQKVIILRFVAGLSAVQIAEQLGKRPGTVRVWLHRAYKILRKDLAPLLEEVEP